MRNFIVLILAFAASSVVSCGGNGVGNSAQKEKTCPEISDTPTAAYTRLYSAVKAKNTDAIKTEMSSNTQSFAVGISERQKSSIEKVFENGFTATTFSETLPLMRDERLSSCWAALEVRNSRDQMWEDLPFANEDGKWKLAVGEVFAGTYKSPGKSQSTKEKEAANAMAGNNPQPANMMNNSNTATMANTTNKPPKFDGPQVEPLPNKK